MINFIATLTPSSPPRPSLSSSTSSTIVLNFYEVEDNGGSEITTYELYINNCDEQSEPDTKVAGYTDNSMQYSVSTSEITTLSGGEICTFKTRAVNMNGYSANSTVFSAAMADEASAPNAPYKVHDESTNTSITIQWDAPAGTQIPGGNILGYRLYMRKANGGEKQIVYEKQNLKSVRKYTATSLETGEGYVFSVQAYQFNKYTNESPEVTVYACTSPTLLDPPTLASSNNTHIDLQWKAPVYCGGCAINGYALFMDDGQGGAFSDIDTSTIQNDSSIVSHTVSTFPSNSEGNTFMFKLEVYTNGGQATSSEIGYPLASLPDTPTNAPQSTNIGIITSDSSSYMFITITAQEVTANGGNNITSYSIEADDGAGGVFTALYGDTVDSLSLTYTMTNVTEGATYRLRYRAKNAIGWTDYSPVGYVTAQAVPEAPSAPVFVSADQTKITLQLSESDDNNGAQIDYYDLYRNNGAGTTDIINITHYDGSSLTFELNTTDDSTLVAGETYTFTMRAHNQAGYSEYSDSVAVALARVPEQLTAPTRVDDQSNTLRITIEWVPKTDRDIPGGNVTGFYVYMAEGLGGSFSKVFTATSASTIQYTATSLTPGNAYKFKVSAYNFNGEGAESDILTTYACDSVTGIDPPSYLIATSETMTVSWQEPTSNGSCPILSYALFMDHQTPGTLAEVNTDNDTSIREKPTLRQVTITTISSSNIGTDYSLQLKVQTIMGWFDSEIVGIRFATVPGKPSTAPQEVTASTSSTQVTVSYSSSDTGGSPISGYHLQYGQGIAGPFIDLTPADTGSMATSYTLTNVTQGQTYYFRFRVKNQYGWSDYSDIGYAKASDVPGQASAPEIMSYSNVSIVLTLDPNVE